MQQNTPPRIRFEQGKINKQRDSLSLHVQWKYIVIVAGGRPPRLSAGQAHKRPFPIPEIDKHPEHGTAFDIEVVDFTPLDLMGKQCVGSTAKRQGAPV